MAVTVSYPGVYVEEFAPAAPIQGVATSTAGFVGINGVVLPNRPVRLTSWDAFVQGFTADAGATPPDDDDHLWYAVRGFFANGGKTCFVAAVSNAAAAAATLNDAGNRAALKVHARSAGVASPPLRVTATPTSTVANASLSEPLAVVGTTAADRRSVTLATAAHSLRFRAGEQVLIDLGAGNANETAQIARIVGADLVFSAPLAASRDGKVLRLAPLVPFATQLRVDDAAGLVPGSVVELSQTNGPTPLITVVTAVSEDRVSATSVSWRVTVRDGLDGFELYKANAAAVRLRSLEFTLAVTGRAQPYTGLSMNPAHPRWVGAVVNADAAGPVSVEPVAANAGLSADNRPTGNVTLSGGATHDAAKVRDQPALYYPAALDALAEVADVNLLCAPGCANDAVQRALHDQCKLLADRFALVDARPGASIDELLVQRATVMDAKGFAALYHPWVKVASARSGNPILVPPSGHVAGVIARTDLDRGVFKAPAGNECELRGTLGVERVLSDTDQGTLNLKGVNVIRVFQHGGTPIVWGARTTSDNTNWQYVNIRRLFIFLEQSIQRGIRGAVFEPNNPSLWKRLQRTLGAFLTQQWRDGALFGNKAEEAFYVRIDEVLNPDSQRALGRLTIEIGVRPSYPAEFIVVRIGIWQGGSSVDES